METVLISGGSGLVGRRLSLALEEAGYGIAILTRNPDQQEHIRNYSWDPDNNFIDEEAIAGADYIVHLAGANLGEKRWTNRRRKEIVDSRIKSGQLLFDLVKKTSRELKGFISASAMGYYGSLTSEKIFTEEDPPGTDFAAEVCRLWEAEAGKFGMAGIRTVIIRAGIVLTPSGGALGKMAAVVRAGLGSPLGSGSQYLPWIHIDDLCGIYLKALSDSSMKGPYNAVAPDQRTNREFTRTLAGALHRPFFAPRVPTPVLKLLYGEMSGMLLRGSRLSAGKIMREGFSFRFPGLKEALEDVLR